MGGFAACLAVSEPYSVLPMIVIALTSGNCVTGVTSAVASLPFLDCEYCATIPCNDLLNNHGALSSHSYCMHTAAYYNMQLRWESGCNLAVQTSQMSIWDAFMHLLYVAYMAESVLHTPKTHIHDKDCLHAPSHCHCFSPEQQVQKH